LKEEVKKSFALALSINSKLEQEAGRYADILYDFLNFIV
jgi:hypothetical protein